MFETNYRKLSGHNKIQGVHKKIGGYCPRTLHYCYSSGALFMLWLLLIDDAQAPDATGVIRKSSIILIRPQRERKRA